MKISKLFHWLYASVIFLPLLVIPIFAIYSINHSIDSYEVTREKYKVVDFNQMVSLPNNVTTNTNFSTFTYDDDTITIDVNVNTAGFVWQSGLRHKDLAFIDNHVYLVIFRTSYEGVLYSELNDNTVAYVNTGYERYYRYQKGSSTSGMIGLGTGVTGSFDVIDLNIFDLTYIFGVGNEPTYEVFRSYFPNDYYDVGTRKVIIQDYVIHYDDTDIGSQFVYSLYNTVDKYFNFDNVFNFGDLYSWLVITFFNGNSPLGFFIFWHYLIYWLLISLLWLLFDVLIYVPNLVHRWLDKAAIE